MTLSDSERVTLEKYLQKQIDLLDAAARERLQAWIDAHEKLHQMEAERLGQYQAAHQQMHDAMAESLRVALENLKAWQAAANEWRGTLQDQRGAFLTVPTFTAERNALIGRIERIEQAGFVTKRDYEGAHNLLYGRVEAVEKENIAQRASVLTVKEDTERSQSRTRNWVLIIGITLAIVDFAIRFPR
jgi:hypothetical protein